MSYEELEKHGIFLPKTHWGESELNRPSSPWLLAGLGVVGGSAFAAMALGGGRSLTWLGTGVFLLTLWGFTWVATRAIDRQNRRLEAVGHRDPGAGETGDRDGDRSEATEEGLEAETDPGGEDHGGR
jgi:hypothetical protein